MLLEDKIKSFFKDKEEVIAVYLFGSYAYGKSKPFSDIDIGIIIDESFLHRPIDYRDRYLVQLSKILRKDIHPVILNYAGEELHRQIFSKGKCILINNSKKLTEYKMIMYAKIAEFGYYKSIIQEGFTKKITEDVKID